MADTNFAEGKIWSGAFSPASGTQEVFFTGISSGGLPLPDALEELAGKYRAALDAQGLDASTQQFVRIYLSDIANDREALLNSSLYKIASQSAFGVLQQRPLGNAEAGILAYHIKSPGGSFRKEFISSRQDYNNQCVVAQGRNYSLLWTSSFIGGAAFDSIGQTRDIFSDLSAALGRHGMTIRNNVIRTWIFVRDIENHYKGMVKTRREYFEDIGLTAQTRYIASTGINGIAADPATIVTLDALSVGNIREEQIVRMAALDHMSDTIKYGVTFERGFRIRYGDRSHLYISGTASIDAEGNTIYIADIRKQTMRTLDNIEALLKPHNATLNDMQYLIIYLRNPKHWASIQDILAARIPARVAIIPVEASVCRPNWLIEMEGVGIIPDSTGFPAFA